VRHNVRILTAIVAAAVLSLAAPAAQSREGIKVHGDWTIEVRNPDGTLVGRHEFKNALVAGAGDVALAGLLGRLYSTGQWRVDLDGTARICQDPDGRSVCISTESPLIPGAESWMFPTLRVAATYGGTTTELTGTITARFDGNITNVSSFLMLCYRTVSPALCGTGDLGNVDSFLRVTQKALPSPISVAAGQIVQFKVVLSFS
jgi:hypothetical protein